jgi:GNAT superfamily N-acetyltransferase
MAHVADLVESCFADTLDEGGRYYLQRMRAGSGATGLGAWFGWLTSLMSAPMSGYVWEQDGRIVGNASLIPVFANRHWFYLIANVAVAPEARRQGIARRLTQQSIEHARQRHSKSVWLQVRQENEAAITLYKNLGFIERARRTAWVCDSSYIPPNSHPETNFAPVNARHWQQQRLWLLRSYPPELSWHILFNPTLLQSGLAGALARLFTDTYLVQWGAFQNERLLAALSWQSMPGPTDVLWVSAPPSLDEDVLLALLLHIRRDLPGQRSITLDYPAGLFGSALHQAGFIDSQTLIWMEKKLA